MRGVALHKPLQSPAAILCRIFEQAYGIRCPLLLEIVHLTRARLVPLCCTCVTEPLASGLPRVQVLFCAGGWVHTELAGEVRLTLWMLGAREKVIHLLAMLHANQ